MRTPTGSVSGAVYLGDGRETVEKSRGCQEEKRRAPREPDTQDTHPWLSR